MSSDTKLSKDEECESIDSTKYRGMIGSLLYLMESRLDIMFSVCLCARFQEAPKTSHLEAVKHIFRYIKCTTHLGLWYPKGTDIETVVYDDYDHAGDYVDRKSTSGQMLIEFVIQNQFFSYTLEEFAQILDIPCDGACVFIDKWSLDELAYGVPRDDPYQTNPPSPDDIILYIRNDREGLSYVLYDRVMNPLTAQQERKTRKDCGTRRGCNSTSSSSAFDQPSSSHLNNDDDDGNEEGTSRASTPSPTCFVNSLTNKVPQVFQNPPNIDPDMEPFYTCQTKIINHQVQL
ncbi:hypothetical protein Tco_1412531 [Tanacetum coccineum]